MLPLPWRLRRHWSAFNLSSSTESIDVDATFGQGVDIESEPWYPRVAVNSVTEAVMEPPSGFTSHIMHVRWDSLPMLLPDGDLNSGEWWESVTSTWGEWMEGSPLSVASN
ncbi:MAG: hypothetical protein MKZ56_07150, partial [Candidatus Thalassarchaeum sp.]|nr:hypothetical protein [Candidatus Thalassarchaeum sp.]